MTLQTLTGDEAMQAVSFRAAVGELASTAPLEDLADEAFLAMSKLREKLVLSDRNTPACRVDEAIEALQAACQEFVK